MLSDNIKFNQELGYISTPFLQCNGIRIMDDNELKNFIHTLKYAGITKVDTTFYGNCEYHDRFSARKGDYDFMLRLAKVSVSLGITCAPSIFVCEENKELLGELFDIISGITGSSNIHVFLQDYRGRGYLLEDARLTAAGYASLPQKIKDRINLRLYKTEADWLNGTALPEYTKRALIVNLRNDNIEMFEEMPCDEIITYIEKLDDDYYSAIPPINALAEIYGDKSNNRLYRPRDLFWKWQKQYIRGHNIDLYDITDERHCCTVRS
jgi:hypothetical protein